MPDVLRSIDVFTPNAFPAWTYVEREPDFENQVMNALRTPNVIISVSGPSKSGKSVLLQKVVGTDWLICIFGPQIKSPEDVWDAALDWVGSPATKTEQRTTTTAVGGQASFSVLGVFNIGGRTDTSDAAAMASTQSTTDMRTGLIPRLTDQNRWAQLRKPMDIMVQG
jgi:hypothetical protein